MTKRKASAPNQVELIQKITSTIEHSGYEFLTDYEKAHNTLLLEGEWNYRVDRFVNEFIADDKLSKDYAKAVIARLYRGHIPRKVYEKNVQVLKEPAEPKTSKEDMVAKLKKIIK